MGYRSTFVTDGRPLPMPQWFIEKWKEHVNFAEGWKTPISSKQEAKTYGLWQRLELDIQKALKEIKPDDQYGIAIVFMGEDGELKFSRIFVNEICGDHITDPEPDRIQKETFAAYLEANRESICADPQDAAE